MKNFLHYLKLNFLPIVLCVLSINTIWAQAPQKMSYQAVIRDGSNVLIVNTQIGVQVSILQGSSSGTPVYVETHLPTTNTNGLASFEIGGGSIISGSFSGINWSAGPYFLKTETDPDGNTGGLVYTIVGTSQLLSVPYALYSASSDSSSCCSNQWHLLGNANTTDGVHFLGTTDNVPFNLRVNNQKAGRVDHLLRNTFWGFQSGNSNTTGTGNVANGFTALFANGIGKNNTAIGDSTMYNNGIGATFAYQSGNNTATGAKSLFSNTLGHSNSSFGAYSLYLNTTGTENTATGFKSLYNNTTASNNTANGSYTLHNNTTGFENTAMGVHSLYNNTIGQQNTALGAFTMQFNTTGSVNTVIGQGALNLNTTGSYNCGFGFQTLLFNTTGTHNVASGYLSMNENTTGYQNAAYGSFALNSNISGYLNTAVGYTALTNTTLSNGNTALGANAGDYFLNNGDNNTFIGYNTSALVGALNNTTTIGYNAKVSIDNAMVLGATGSDAVTVGIGTTAPHSRMHVNGSLATAIIAKNSAYTAGIDDQVITVTGITTITLPSAAGIAGRIYTIKRMDALNATTIATTGIETIDGAATLNINSQYAGITVISDGGNWVIIGRF